MSKLAGRLRTAVVTGAASGIGQAVASRLTGEGFRIIGVDLANEEVSVDLAKQVGREQASLLIHKLSPEGIDVVITCAGVGGSGTSGAQVSAVNFFGTTRLLALLRPHLALGHAPRAVVISSSTSLLGYDSDLLKDYLRDDEQSAIDSCKDSILAYCTGKRALCHWVREKAVLPEWAGSGILLNAVAPGLVATPLTRSALSSPAGRTAALTVAPSVLPDFPSADEIAPLICFLASAQNSNMVGQVIYCDGGSDVLIRGPVIP